MNLSIVAIALISAFVAYANGANDVSKGIATLAGSGFSSYQCYSMGRFVDHVRRRCGIRAFSRLSDYIW